MEVGEFPFSLQGINFLARCYEVLQTRAITKTGIEETFATIKKILGSRML